MAMRDDSTSVTPMVSFVLPVKNEEKNLPDIMLSLARQTYRSFELLIVDNGSSDSSASLARELADAVPNCSIIEASGALSDARNAGVKSSTGEILFFIDADQVLASTCLEACVQAISDPQTEAVVVPERPYTTEKWLHKLMFLERELSEESGRGIPRVYKRDKYNRMGAHVEDVLFGEDAAVKFKYSDNEIRIAHEATIFHKELETLSLMLVKYFRYGRSYRGDKVVGPVTTHGAMDFLRLAMRRAAHAPLPVLGVLALKLAKFAALRGGQLAAPRRLG